MPSAHNAPGFTSFSDYLNANAGSLEKERQAGLTAADSAGQKAQTDLTGTGQTVTDPTYQPAIWGHQQTAPTHVDRGLEGQAYGQGAQNAASAWSAANPNGPGTVDAYGRPTNAQGASVDFNGNPLTPGAATTAATAGGGQVDSQGNPMSAADASNRATQGGAQPGQFDVTSLQGYSGFLADRQKAMDSLGSLQDGGLGSNGRGAFEAGLVGADKGYQGAGAALGQKYSGLSDYLGGLQAQGAAGAASFVAPKPTNNQPADVTSYQESGNRGAGNPDTGDSNNPGYVPAGTPGYDYNQDQDQTLGGGG